jgi:hypothetical protein
MARPTGITVLAVLFFAAVAFGIVATVVFPISIPVVIAFFAIGCGLWKLKKWAWWGALIVAIADLANVPFGTIVSIIVIIYLSRGHVRRAFGFR